MPLFKKRKEEETTTDIFKYDYKKGYSGLSYERVLSFLGIKNNILFSKDEDIDEKEINNEVIKRISTLLIILTRAFGIVNSGNESKRKEFISTIIYNVVNEYYEKNVEILKDYIDGDDVKGPVEYVIVHNKYILIVIEAKKDDFDQGRAQLLMQLYNAYIENIKNGAPNNHSIYGTVTTGYTWEFIWCKGNDNIKDVKDVRSNMIWHYKQQIHPIELNLEKDQEQWEKKVSPLVKKLNYMIDDSLQQIAKNN
ncbi:hypothetical protein BJ944DRAFT_268359 [Cunninghamella echinulata]|nr:hypothetical protein BJ944DRAFT_268359 [Cunninghamella echinulata]